LGSRPLFEHNSQKWVEKWAKASRNHADYHASIDAYSYLYSQNKGAFTKPLLEVLHLADMSALGIVLFASQKDDQLEGLQLFRKYPRKAREFLEFISVVESFHKGTLKDFQGTKNPFLKSFSNLLNSWKDALPLRSKITIEDPFHIFDFLYLYQQALARISGSQAELRLDSEHRNSLFLFLLDISGFTSHAPKSKKPLWGSISFLLATQFPKHAAHFRWGTQYPALALPILTLNEDLPLERQKKHLLSLQARPAFLPMLSMAVGVVEKKPLISAFINKRLRKKVDSKSIWAHFGKVHIEVKGTKGLLRAEKERLQLVLKKSLLRLKEMGFKGRNLSLRVQSSPIPLKFDRHLNEVVFSVSLMRKPVQVAANQCTKAFVLQTLYQQRNLDGINRKFFPFWLPDALLNQLLKPGKDRVVWREERLENSLLFPLSLFALLHMPYQEMNLNEFQVYQSQCREIGELLFSDIPESNQYSEMLRLLPYAHSWSSLRKAGLNGSKLEALENLLRAHQP
jgi:hypothetical protein